MNPPSSDRHIRELQRRAALGDRDAQEQLALAMQRAGETPAQIMRRAREGDWVEFTLAVVGRDREGLLRHSQKRHTWLVAEIVEESPWLHRRYVRAYSMENEWNDEDHEETLGSLLETRDGKLIWQTGDRLRKRGTRVHWLQILRNDKDPLDEDDPDVRRALGMKPKKNPLSELLVVVGNPPICDPCATGAHAACHSDMAPGACSCWCTRGTQRYSSPAEQPVIRRKQRVFLQGRRNPPHHCTDCGARVSQLVLMDLEGDQALCPPCFWTAADAGDPRCCHCSTHADPNCAVHGGPRMNPRGLPPLPEGYERPRKRTKAEMKRIYDAVAESFPPPPADWQREADAHRATVWYCPKHKIGADSKKQPKCPRSGCKARMKRLNPENAPEPSPRGARKKIGKTPRLKGEVELSEIEALFSDEEISRAQDRYDMWHGEPAQHALYWQADDGKPGVRRKLVVAQGVVPKALYQVPWDGSTKGDALWEHDFVAGKEPIRAIDPETNVTLELPTNPKAVADSFLREGGPGSDY